jgi:hypothetical protein
MLGILTKPIFGRFFQGNITSKNNSDDTNSNLIKINSEKILSLKILIDKLENYLPTNKNHLSPTTPNHLDEIKELRDLVSEIKLNLSPCYKILMNLKSNNFNLHDSITACDMILGLLQQWDKNEILTAKENKNLNKVLVFFSSNMHDILISVKF